MIWKIIILISLGLFITSCADSPESNAEKVCNCGDEIIQLAKDGADIAELEKKEDECEHLFDKFEKMYRDNKENMEKFMGKIDECGKRIDREYQEILKNRGEE